MLSSDLSKLWGISMGVQVRDGPGRAVAQYAFLSYGLYCRSWTRSIPVGLCAPMTTKRKLDPRLGQEFAWRLASEGIIAQYTLDRVPLGLFRFPRRVANVNAITMYNPRASQNSYNNKHLTIVSWCPIKLTPPLN